MIMCKVWCDDVQDALCLFTKFTVNVAQDLLEAAVEASRLVAAEKEAAELDVLEEQRAVAAAVAARGPAGGWRGG